jgi:hypothetical protein
MLPKFRGLGTPNEKTVAMSAEAEMEPVIDCALAREGTATRPSAARRRRERFTGDSWRVVERWDDLEYRPGGVSSLLALEPALRYIGGQVDQFLGRIL